MTNDHKHEAYIRLATHGYRPPPGREYTDPRLLVAATRIAIDDARRQKMTARHVERYFATQGERLNPIVRFSSVDAASSNPATIAIAKEAEGRVRMSLMALDPRSRAVVYLRYFEGVSVRSIATHVGETRGAVGSRLDRARRRLRQAFPDYGNDASA